MKPAKQTENAFTILVESLGEARDANIVAEKILQAMQAPFMIGSHVLAVLTSVGIVFSDGRDANAEELMQKADAAMYQSKRGAQSRHAAWHTAAAGFRTQ